jgi:4-hydroxy-tetrahydrodipicolinate synthase
MQEMVNLYLDGDVKQAAAKHRKLVPVMNALFTSPSPTPVKAALQMKGIETGSVRLPLLPLTDDERNLLKEKIDM